jgi:hypothetical protein
MSGGENAVFKAKRPFFLKKEKAAEVNPSLYFLKENLKRST